MGTLPSHGKSHLAKFSGTGPPPSVSTAAEDRGGLPVCALVRLGRRAYSDPTPSETPPVPPASHSATLGPVGWRRSPVHQIQGTRTRSGSRRRMTSPESLPVTRPVGVHPLFPRMLRCRERDPADAPLCCGEPRKCRSARRSPQWSPAGLVSARGRSASAAYSLYSWSVADAYPPARGRLGMTLMPAMIGGLTTGLFPS
jgi:hypothetical protein